MRPTSETRRTGRLISRALICIGLCLSPVLVTAQDRDILTRLEPGTLISVRTNETIETSRADNRVYTSIVDRDARGDNGRLAIPRGASVELVVRTAPDNNLILDLESVTVDGHRYGLRAEPNRIESRTDNTVLGAIVGAITGDEIR